MRIRRLALASCLLFAFAPVACGDGGGGADQPTPEEVLDRAADRMASLENFAFVLEHENGSTVIPPGLYMDRAQGMVAGGERLKADVLTRAGPINANVSIVILPDSAWMTNPLTQQWTPADLSISQLFDPATGVPALLRELDSPELLGVEPTDGAQSYHVRAQIASAELVALAPQAVPGRSLVAHTWIGVDDPVVHRVELVGALEEDDTEQTVRRLTLSDFDAAVTIEAPNR